MIPATVDEVTVLRENVIKGDLEHLRHPENIPGGKSAKKADRESLFDFDVSENPEAKSTKRPRIQIQPLDGEEKLPIEEAAEYRFKLVNEDTGEAQVDLEDVWVWVFSSRGWSTRTVAEHVEDGVYKIELTLPMSGMYQMIVASQTLNVRFEDTFPVVLRAAKE